MGLVFVSACSRASTPPTCPEPSEPAIAELDTPIEISSDQDQRVRARWLAQGDALEFEWLEAQVHARLNQSPRDLARWAALARLHLDRAVRDEIPSELRHAALILAEADRIGADSAELELVRGLLAQLEGRHDHAVVAWQRAVDLDPALAEARLRLGVAMLEHRDFAGAKLELLAHAELAPEDAEGWLALGVAHAHTHEPSQAAAAYARAAKLAPDDPRPHWNLFWLRWTLEEFDQDELDIVVAQTRMHIVDVLAIPAPACEAAVLPDPLCLAALEQHRQIAAQAPELDTTVLEFRATMVFMRGLTTGRTRPNEAEQAEESQRRQKLLELERAAQAAELEAAEAAGDPRSGETG